MSFQKSFHKPCCYAITLALFSTAGWAQATPEAHHSHAQPHSASASKKLTAGLVKKVDRTNASLTIAHGPLPNGMPAMTMMFKVKDPQWLEKIKVDQKIRFAMEEVNGIMTVNDYEVQP